MVRQMYVGACVCFVLLFLTQLCKVDHSYEWKQSDYSFLESSKQWIGAQQG